MFNEALKNVTMPINPMLFQQSPMSQQGTQPGVQQPGTPKTPQTPNTPPNTQFGGMNPFFQSNPLFFNRFAPKIVPKLAPAPNGKTPHLQTPMPNASQFQTPPGIPQVGQTMHQNRKEEINEDKKESKMSEASRQCDELLRGCNKVTDQVRQKILSFLTGKIGIVILSI